MRRTDATLNNACFLSILYRFLQVSRFTFMIVDERLHKFDVLWNSDDVMKTYRRRSVTPAEFIFFSRRSSKKCVTYYKNYGHCNTLDGASLFLLLARYVHNVARRSIWDQCNIEDRPTTDLCSWKRKNFKRPYLHNGARRTHGHTGSPIGNRPPGAKWSRDRWRYVTPKGQGSNPIFEAPYLRNGAR